MTNRPAKIDKTMLFETFTKLAQSMKAVKAILNNTTVKTHVDIVKEFVEANPKANDHATYCAMLKKRDFSLEQLKKASTALFAMRQDIDVLRDRLQAARSELSRDKVDFYDIPGVDDEAANSAWECDNTMKAPLALDAGLDPSDADIQTAVRTARDLLLPTATGEIVFDTDVHVPTHATFFAKCAAEPAMLLFVFTSVGAFGTLWKFNLREEQTAAPIDTPIDLKQSGLFKCGNAKDPTTYRYPSTTPVALRFHTFHPSGFCSVRNTGGAVLFFGGPESKLYGKKLATMYAAAKTRTGADVLLPLPGNSKVKKFRNDPFVNNFRCRRLIAVRVSARTAVNGRTSVPTGHTQH